MSTRPLRRVGIVGGSRIPFCRQNTAYVDLGNFGMSVKAVGAVVERFGLAGVELGEVALGAVMKHSSDWNLGREVALSSGLSPRTPGITMARACGTGLDTAIMIANKIATGQIESGIAGGSRHHQRRADRVRAQVRRAPARHGAREDASAQRLAAWKGFRPSASSSPAFPACPSRAPARAWASTAR